MRTYTHTRTHTNTYYQNTPDSGLGELTKRENPANISSPLKSTHNDDRIGLPMEISHSDSHALTYTSMYTNAFVNTDTNIQKENTHTERGKWSVFASWPF